MTQDSSAEYAKRLEAKLAPARIRSTLAFAGLYQLTHELLKTTILDDVKGFFGFSSLVDGGAWLHGEEARKDYERDVLSKAQSPFKASLLWLQEAGAIDEGQVERLSEIYRHRHDLTHGLGNYILDPDREPDVGLFIDAVTILGAIHRFFTQVEIDIGTFQHHGDVEVNDVTPASLIFLRMCIDAYIGELPDETVEEEEPEDSP